MQDRPPGDDVIIERQAGQLSRLVDDLLEVSRITTGKVRLQRERLDLRGIVERAVEAARPAIEHGERLFRREPAAVIQLGNIHMDLPRFRLGVAADHQGMWHRPGLRGMIANAADMDAGLFMRLAAHGIFDQLNWKMEQSGKEERFSLADAEWGKLPDGHVIGKPVPLFPRIET